MQEKKMNANGVKARQRSDNVDRAQAYREWCRDTGTKGDYMGDIDSVEWRGIGGKLLPVAIIEITMAEKHITVNDKYLETIIWRVFTRDHWQGEMATYAAKALNVRAYLTLYREGCTEFWVYSFARKEWKHFTPEQYQVFRHNLKPIQGSVTQSV